MRPTVIAACGLLCAAFVLAPGCASPYSAPPEELPRPTPKQGGGNSKANKMAEKCRTNFFAPPFKGHRDIAAARNLARDTDPILLRADGQSGDQRKATVMTAMGKLRLALKKDPYGPAPTYRLAVAYALVHRPGCAVRLLQRLDKLKAVPKTASEAQRLIERAKQDIAFDPFRKEANAALSK